jgi:hypothetical protein
MAAVAAGAAAAGGVAMVAIDPAAAAAPPIVVKAFSVSPSCTHPGGTLTATDTVQTTTGQDQTFFIQTRTYYYGALFQTSKVYGPYITGPHTTSTTVTQTAVPLFTPFGSFATVFGVGPSRSDAMGWSTASAGWSVEPQPFC